MHADVGNRGLRHVKSAITPRKKSLSVIVGITLALRALLVLGEK